MTPWIFLSKKGNDEYINLFARGSGEQPTVLETWNYDSSDNPLVLRGILKYKIVQRCWADQRPFLFMDSGYFGNRPNANNPGGWKVWHRVVPNNYQHGDIIPRPPDRWERLNIRLKPRQQGTRILIAAPDEKPCIVYDVDLQQWLNQTVETIKKFTDRPIEIRHRNPDRQHRQLNDFTEALRDVHCVVTFNSNAAVEAVMAGVPVYALAPCSAAAPVSNRDFEKIDNPWFPNDDIRQAWCQHLAYGQFHNNELSNGLAASIIRHEWP